MAEDFTKRFTGRASFYSTSRPSYPPRILDILISEIDFDDTYIVADIGSGTGLLSQLFLENGNRVFGVEPNDEMRLRRAEPRQVSKISECERNCGTYRS